MVPLTVLLQRSLTGCVGALVLLAGQLLTGLLQLQAVGVQVSLETLDTVYQVLLTDDENVSETVPLICQSEL